MSFLYTNVLFFMLIPTFILLYFIINRLDGFSKHFNKEVLEKLSVSSEYFSNKARNIILFLSLIFMIIALSRPVTNEKIHNSKQELNALVIAIDVSKSMMATDIYPNRLEFARKKLLDIIEQNKNTAIGVILFAKSSFILSPITQDFVSLKILINNLDTGMNFDNGTNIYSTLEVTNKLLKNFQSKNLLLLSDGGDKENFEKEIKYANKNKINVYSIGLASKKGAAIKLKDNNYLVNKDGSIVTVKLNESIKELSLKTNAGYINYSLNNNDVEQIMSDIESKSTKEEFKEKKFKTYTELFYYPLALAILFLLIAFSSLPSFKRKKTLINSFLLISIFSLTNTSLKAEVFDFQKIKKAEKAYSQENYKEANKQFNSIKDSQEKEYNLANSLYKMGKYDESIKKYNEIKSDDKDLEFKKHHNIGNAHVHKKDLEAAKKAYENALKLKDDKETKENLDLVNKALEKKKQDKKQNKDQKNKKKQDNKKDKKKENKDSKDQKSQDDKKESKDKKPKSGEKKENKNKSEKNKDNNKQKDKVEKAKEIKQNNISDKEEKRWLEQLNHQKTNSLLKKMDTSKNDGPSNPW